MDCTPQIHVAAYHAEAGYRGDTPGLAVLCHDGRSSNYAVLGWQPWTVAGVKLGGFAGFVTGYRDHAMPFAAAAVSVGNVHT